MTGTALWYASRATGVVLLLLMTGVTLLGVLVNRQGRLPGLPRFAVTGLHRNLSLLSIGFLAAHVTTAIVDGYVNIPWISTVVPFTSHYKALWLGLGTVAVDLLAAIVVTSLLRSRLPQRMWKAVHWAAYAIFPLTLVHSIGSSRDLRSGWLLGLAASCGLAVAGSVGYRVLGADTPRARRVLNLLHRTSPAGGTS